MKRTEHSPLHRATVTATVALVGLIVALSVLVSSAHAATAPWWKLSLSSAPTDLQPGMGEAVLIATASNIGDTPTKGTITLTDTLPAGLTAKAVKLFASIEHQPGTCETLPVLRCSFTGVVQPYEQLQLVINVTVQAGLSSGQLPEQLQVQGGEANSTSLTRALTVAASATPFGVEGVELTPETAGGSPDLQAGSHPYQLSTKLAFNQTLDPHTNEPSAPALLKNLHFDLPAGLVGDPQATPKCSNLDFSTLFIKNTNLCPPDTAVGAALVTLNEPANTGYVSLAVPLFNLEPGVGEPARFGFEAFNVPVVLDTAVRSGRDYSVQVNVANATSAAQILASQVVFWGEPGDQSHDSARGWQCILAGADDPEGETCEPPDPRPTTPLLTLPTSCETPLTAQLNGESWTHDTFQASAEIPVLSGCQQLPFNPSIDAAAQSHASSTPTAFTVTVKLPQTATLMPGGLAEADVRDSTVTLPQGVQLSPSAANGLEACSEAQAGFEGPGPDGTLDFANAKPACPDASKVGVVHIRTPLLSHELEGAVYLATPAPNGEPSQNPFNSLVALYLVAEDPLSGVLVKLAGEGHLDESTGQISTSFHNTPQVPFEELRLELFDGPRASLSTPPTCGAFQTEGVFTPWSGIAPVSVLSPASELQIGEGVGGTPCPSGALAFDPGFQAQSTNATAAGFTDFQLELSRPDGDQALSSVAMHLPSGVAALLSSVTLCSEAQAQTDACPPPSLVGDAAAIAGLGPEPYVESGGKVYITGPYHGAPFGLEIVTPAVAGPFNLGTVTVRSRLYIDPNNASVTIISDPLPTQLRGIPLQLKRVLVNVDRPGFEFNPTNCSPTRIDGTISGDQGASVPVSSPFQVGGCQNLPFKPKLTASTKGQASKANGASFNVTVRSGGVAAGGVAQAGIAKVRLQLPKALPARLTTLQKACTEGAFNKDPASCPEGSVIGQATIHTPVLSNPLTGPAYLVSHGGAAFPDVEFVLQGEGITLVLDGKTQIKGQITYSKFESAPDAPFTVFETVLPAGPHSALTTNLPEKDKFNLCKSSLSMPTEIVGQNGAVLKQTTKVALQGCKKVKAARPLSRAQILKRALASCRELHKHSKAKRVACEKQARKRDGAKKVVHKLARSPLR